MGLGDPKGEGPGNIWAWPPAYCFYFGDDDPWTNVDLIAHESIEMGVDDIVTGF